MPTAPEPKHLLIVDDSRVSRMMIRNLVSRHRPGWHVREAASAQEAFQALDEALPDCMTMDINMPGLPGIDAAEQISRDHPGAMRIALFSANVQSAYQERAAAMAMCFVAKPVTDKSVLQAISFFEEGV